MIDRDNPLSPRDIDASNVLPAFEASLRFGLTEADLARELGWRREALQADGATVTGASTYRHMEIMFARPDFADFVLSATERHTGASLGVVGLACKTAATVGAAMLCHQRYQHLTNRTARYDTRIDGAALTIREDRFGASCLGSRLVSDYTMLVALRLVRLLGASAVVRCMRSRRPSLPDAERARYEAFLDAPIEANAEAAELVLDAAILGAPIASADAELSTYLRRVLERASPPAPDEPQLLRQIRSVLPDSLVEGQANAGHVAKRLGLGQRTLQRRLARLGTTFEEVLEATRRRLADTYLSRPELSLGEIAYLLGYREQASFHRAFRRWHDTTPAAYRRTLRGGEAP